MTASAGRPGTRRRDIWLWLLVIFVGIRLGGGLYEKLAIVPLWAEVPGDQVLAQMHSSGMYLAGRAFWPFVSPVVALLAVVNLGLAWRSEAAHRRWWLASAGLMTLYALASYGYFVPTMLTVQSRGATWSAAEIESVLGLWTALNWPRMLIGAAGWLCALRALSLTSAGSGRSLVGTTVPGSTSPRSRRSGVRAGYPQRRLDAAPRPRRSRADRRSHAQRVTCRTVRVMASRCGR